MNSEWVLRADDDGHWYLIPLSREAYFDDLLMAEDQDSFNYAFAVYRIDGPISIVIKQWEHR